MNKCSYCGRNRDAQDKTGVCKGCGAVSAFMVEPEVSAETSEEAARQIRSTASNKWAIACYPPLRK